MTPRAYRPGLEEEQAREVIERGAGRQWNPEVAKTFSEQVMGKESMAGVAAQEPPQTAGAEAAAGAEVTELMTTAGQGTGAATAEESSSAVPAGAQVREGKLLTVAEVADLLRINKSTGLPDGEAGQVAGHPCRTSVEIPQERLGSLARS